MMTRQRQNLGFLALLSALAVLTACQDVPFLEHTTRWFSSSPYDPEIDAIERKVPPPEEPFYPAVNANGAPRYVLSAAGAHVVAGPPVGMTIRLGTSPFARANALEDSGIDGQSGATASLTRSAQPPPLGYSRARRIIYGGNRAPFRASPMRSLR